MPPLGTVVRDDEAIALVRRWVEGMKAPQPPSLPATSFHASRTRPAPSETLDRTTRVQAPSP